MRDLYWALVVVVAILIPGAAHADERSLRLAVLSDSIHLRDNVLVYSCFAHRNINTCSALHSSMSSDGSYSQNQGYDPTLRLFGRRAMIVAFNHYSDLWFSFIDQHEVLVRTSQLLWAQFEDLAERLEILHVRRRELLEKFGQYREGESFLEPIDQDIRHLSALGFRLKEVTDRFFATIKPKLIEAEIQREILDARRQALTGLSSFEDEINRVTSMPDEAIDQSLEEIVAAVDRAVRELERAKDN